MAKFSEALPNSGVDNASGWMMVPIKDNVRFLVLQDGTGLKVDGPRQLLNMQEIVGSAHGADPNLIALIRSRNRSARVFTVTGLAAGNTAIHAKDAKGRTLATMDVSVKKKLELNVASGRRPARSRDRAAAHRSSETRRLAPRRERSRRASLSPSA